MKKILLVIGTILGLSLFYTSCNVNSDQVPKFNDKDAFVGFTFISVAVDEDYCTNPKKGNGQYFKIPVTLGSISGVVSSVTIEVNDLTAKADENYILKSGNTLNFTADNRTQYIEFEIIDIPGEFTGDFSFSIKITNGGSVNIGSDNKCTVKISDVDHPLAKLLGNYMGEGNSYFDGPYPVNPTIDKDPDDVTKVWIRNFFYGQNVPFYGIVNQDMTELMIPAGQTTTMNGSETYAVMVGWFVFYYDNGNVNEDLPDEDYDIPDGYNLIINIEDDEGNIKMSMPPLYEIGSYVIPSDAWYEIFIPWPVPGGGKYDYDMNQPMITFIKL